MMMGVFHEWYLNFGSFLSGKIETQCVKFRATVVVVAAVVVVAVVVAAVVVAAVVIAAVVVAAVVVAAVVVVIC